MLSACRFCAHASGRLTFTGWSVCRHPVLQQASRRDHRDRPLCGHEAPLVLRHHLWASRRRARPPAAASGRLVRDHLPVQVHTGWRGRQPSSEWGMLLTGHEFESRQLDRLAITGCLSNMLMHAGKGEAKVVGASQDLPQCSVGVIVKPCRAAAGPRGGGCLLLGQLAVPPGLEWSQVLWGQRQSKAQPVVSLLLSCTPINCRKCAGCGHWRKAMLTGGRPLTHHSRQTAATGKICGAS